MGFGPRVGSGKARTAGRGQGQKARFRALRERFERGQNADLHASASGYQARTPVARLDQLGRLARRSRGQARRKT